MPERSTDRRSCSNGRLSGVQDPPFARSPTQSRSQRKAPTWLQNRLQNFRRPIDPAGLRHLTNKFISKMDESEKVAKWLTRFDEDKKQGTSSRAPLSIIQFVHKLVFIGYMNWICGFPMKMDSHWQCTVCRSSDLGGRNRGHSFQQRCVGTGIGWEGEQRSSNARWP